MFGRKEPLHERLAREGGLVRPDAETPDIPGREAWGEVGIHGVARPRQWDAVVLATAPFSGEWLTFVALPDGDLLADDGIPDEALAPLAASLETSVQPPYRAEAVRRAENRFAVAARRIEVAEVPEEVAGDEVDLTVFEGERVLRVDGEHVFGSIRSLEELGARRFTAFVLRAERLDGALWEVGVSPL